MRILKDINEEGQFVLSIQNNAKSEIKIVGIFAELANMNAHYETVKCTLKALNKKVVCVDNI
jgi:hypothetical protein